jgi:subtilisin family serine protease
MKKKIIGIFVCMLLIVAFVLPTTGTMNERGNVESIKFIDHTKIKFDLCTDVVYTELIGGGYPCGVPNDAGFSKQWYLYSTGKIFWIKFMLVGKIPIIFPFKGKPGADIQAAEAWDIETGSSDVVIAIIDSGVDYTHPDLAANIWNNADEIPNNGIDDDANGYIDDIRGWDFWYNDNNVTDCRGHGTFCAGVAGAVGNNGVGIAGVAWNCKIMPVQVLNESGWGDPEVIAAGIRYATDNDAEVISISLGVYEDISIIKDAVNYAYSKGIFVVSAVGNDRLNEKLYPAAYENVTGVGMTNQKDKVVFNSNYGEWVDIAAPGSLIYSTYPTYPVVGNVEDNAPLNYAFGGGTSYACPQVAGVAALLLSKDPSLTPDEVKALLCENVDQYTGDHYIGTGRLNAYKALAALT